VDWTQLPFVVNNLWIINLSIVAKNDSKGLSPEIYRLIKSTAVDSRLIPEINNEQNIKGANVIMGTIIVIKISLPSLNFCKKQKCKNRKKWKWSYNIHGAKSTVELRLWRYVPVCNCINPISNTFRRIFENISFSPSNISCSIPVF